MRKYLRLTAGFLFLLSITTNGHAAVVSTNDPLVAQFNALKKLAKSTNNADIHYMLANLYAKGIGTGKSLAQAASWYRQAAIKNHPYAQTHLGKIFLVSGPLQNFQKARHWLQKAANNDNAEAQYYLGNILFYGLGTRFQPSSARKWYKKSAKQKFVPAYYQLGLSYELGMGALKRTNKAKRWYQKAEQASYPLASTALQRIREKQNKTLSQLGFPKEPNLVQDILWANEGDISAQYRLGLAYKQGSGLKKNYSTAKNWLEKAAMAGNKNAQYELALMYENGNGVEKNIFEAMIWLSFAAYEGHIPALKMLERLEKN